MEDLNFQDELVPRDIWQTSSDQEADFSLIAKDLGSILNEDIKIQKMYNNSSVEASMCNKESTLNNLDSKAKFKKINDAD